MKTRELLLSGIFLFSSTFGLGCGEQPTETKPSTKPTADVSAYKLTLKPGKNVAIFDYEDRGTAQKTVARSIERGLLRIDSKLNIHQLTAGDQESKALKILQGLDASGLDLIITISSDALLVSRHAVRKTPLLFTNANNPLFLGLNDLKKPGRNISGATYYVPVVKQVELYMKIQPELNHVGLLVDDKNRSRQVEVRETRFAFSKLGLEFHFQGVNSKDEITPAVEKLRAKGVDAIIIASSGLLYNNIALIRSVTDNSKIPVYSYNKKAVPGGAIASLSSDYYLMANKLLIPMAFEVLNKGKNPGEMPVRFLEKNIISINQTVAGKLGLKIPRDVIKQARKKY